MPAIDADLVRPAARGRWIEILGRLAPALEAALERPGRHAGCPVHGGHDGFRLFRDVATTGGGICNTCGARPDGFALLMWINGWRFHEAAESVAAALRLTTNPTRHAAPLPLTLPAPVTPPRNDKQALAALRRVWAGSLPLDHPRADPLWRYLERRGIHAELDPRTLRVHPRLGYFEDQQCRGHFPALISRFCDAEGRPIGLHRTYLTEDGRKAPVDDPKKMMTPAASLTGGAIRLCPVGRCLGIAEGLETALAVRAGTGWPMWAATTAVLLERWTPPPGVERVGIWADLDRSGRGETAAAMLAGRLAAGGIAVDVFVPEGPIPTDAKGKDWADVYRAPMHPAR